MPLTPYTAAEPPDSKQTLILKPRLLSWTARVWRASREQVVPLLKIDAAVDTASVADNDLAESLRPHGPRLSSFPIYLERPEKTGHGPSWSVGTFQIDRDRIFIFLDNFLDNRMGLLMASLLQTAGAQSDLTIAMMPLIVEADRLVFAISDYDLGLHSRFS